MDDMYAFFTAMLVVQLFYSFGVSALTYTTMPLGTPADMAGQYEATASSVGNVTEKLDDSIQRQTNIPIVDMAALVFYSGNIILDLMLNFYFALPSMVTLLISGFVYIFQLNSYIATQLKFFVYGLIGIFYTMGLLSFILNIRSGVKIT